MNDSDRDETACQGEARPDRLGFQQIGEIAARIVRRAAAMKRARWLRDEGVRFLKDESTRRVEPGAEEAKR